MRYVFGIFILAFCCEAKYVPEDGVYSVAENMPEYKGGMAEFQAHIDDYITKNSDNGNGSVFVSFVISEKGDLNNLKIVRSVNQTQDELAMKAIKSAPMKWAPGVEEGKPVSVQMTYSINFD